MKIPNIELLTFFRYMRHTRSLHASGLIHTTDKLVSSMYQHILLLNYNMTDKQCSSAVDFIGFLCCKISLDLFLGSPETSSKKKSSGFSCYYIHRFIAGSVSKPVCVPLVVAEVLLRWSTVVQYISSYLSTTY